MKRREEARVAAHEHFLGDAVDQDDKGEHPENGPREFRSRQPLGPAGQLGEDQGESDHRSPKNESEQQIPSGTARGKAQGAEGAPVGETQHYASGKEHRRQAEKLQEKVQAPVEASTLSPLRTDESDRGSQQDTPEEDEGQNSPRCSPSSFQLVQGPLH